MTLDAGGIVLFQLGKGVVNAVLAVFIVNWVSVVGGGRAMVQVFRHTSVLTGNGCQPNPFSTRLRSAPLC